MRQTGTEACTWCGTGVEDTDGFRAYEPAGERRAVFCRLEHVVPWAIQGPHWEAGTLSESDSPSPGEPVDSDRSAGQGCSHCGSALGEIQVLLVRHRGEHRIPDRFCLVEHMADWAKAGGRWQ